MPLKSGKKNFGRNVAELEKSGHPRNQSLAIAYKESGETKDSESARQEDINGYVEVTGNPISKVGVFEYSGQQIDPTGELNLDPNEIYKVYRSEEELNNQETINSFKLLPWTDNHTMLSGNQEEGLTDPSRKGVHGIIGEQVYFEYPYLKANIKIFSEKLGNLINEGKRELSIGYRCIYEPSKGVYDGEQYEFLQTNLRGNHLALVDEGRSGHDVAVLDQKFTITLDTKDLKMAEKKGDMEKPLDKAKDEGEMSMKEMCAMMKKMAEKLESMGSSEDKFEDEEESEEINGSENLTGEDEVEPEDFVHRENSIDEEEMEKKAEEEGDAKDEDMKREEETGRKDGAMDEKLVKRVMSQISARDTLAKKLSAHIGTFDHANKTLEEVAQYGVKKLKLNCKKGKEQYMLAGFLAGAKPDRIAIAQDSVKKPSSCIDKYLSGDRS